ncbi:MAG: hypothetical protein U1E05_05080, partial [Patescibacteria group bacterium]|nr:hypothetical protein [Patescibacteria group bacterium]
PQFEPHIITLINDDDETVAYLGYDLAMRSSRLSLVRSAMSVSSRRKWLANVFNRHVRAYIPPDTWLAWWRCAVSAIGFIGSNEAEEALKRLLGSQVDDSRTKRNPW